MAREIRIAVYCARILMPCLLIPIILLNLKLDFTYSVIRDERLEKKKMKAACMLAKAVQAQKFGCSAAVKVLLFVLIAFSVLNTVKLPPWGSEDERTSKWGSPVEERQNLDPVNSGNDTRHLMNLAAEVHTQEPVGGIDNSTKPHEANDKSVTESSFIETEKSAENKSTAFNTTQPSVPLHQRQDEVPSSADSLAPGTSIMCEFSDYRYNMCSIEAEVKVIGSSATVLIIPPTSTTPPNTTVWKLKPFTRKWEEATMKNVRELTIRWASDDQEHGPSCDVIHDVPVLIFATAGFRFNPYHDYTDLLIPLFVAAKKYNGKIQFAATNFDSPWISKYLPHLQGLSDYSIINLDSETLVHCFPAGQVGLRGNGPLSAESSSAQNGSTTQEFKQFVRTSLSLKRDRVEIIEKHSNNKPKMAILLRQWTRTFTNEKEIIEMAEGVGFEVIRADTETTKDFPRIAHLINSCDVLMGLHGAGLTNMIYLPNNATVIQIIPWGDMGFISWKDYGEPTKDLELNYVEYEIKVEESTLIEKYPRNHTVFTNPQELHKQGWTAMYNAFMVEQSVKLDVNRFRGVLMGLFNSLTQ